MTATIEGLDTYRAELGLALTRQRPHLDTSLQELVAVLVEQIRQHCPVKTGALRASVRVAGEESAHGVGFSIQVGDDSVTYALHVEYGTSRMPAQPFVRPELEVFRVRYPEHLTGILAEHWGAPG
ncbi:HK97-gp10 family putative phage morphogenesis protein [Accumulibacter sp.]|uniref:HK97-gp10 family putative phage morphogenesis protein n=1 Tax=Accumulibacter sp. TaxID=2053492 RepID=UPI0025E37790|nr:HK97-gp10 family putative phage morphogenesis protein [Accumulibacter sp.]MCM8596650.1 HK97 gp10 family phage protein [Accumulibacter sp.]MCM8625968.1 HK97 gp10 family phage protein [Accumulibacter sp.]MDS4050798.1 HK97 gp10 family phage protein [Accumulibacter sp.]